MKAPPPASNGISMNLRAAGSRRADRPAIRAAVPLHPNATLPRPVCYYRLTCRGRGGGGSHWAERRGWGRHLRKQRLRRLRPVYLDIWFFQFSFGWGWGRVAGGGQRRLVNCWTLLLNRWLITGLPPRAISKTDKQKLAAATEAVHQRTKTRGASLARFESLLGFFGGGNSRSNCNAAIEGLHSYLTHLLFCIRPPAGSTPGRRRQQRSSCTSSFHTSQCRFMILYVKNKHETSQRSRFRL